MGKKQYQERRPPKLPPYGTTPEERRRYREAVRARRAQERNAHG